MTEAIVQQLPSLGISGLLFVMWWHERQERVRGAGASRDVAEVARLTSDVNRSLMDAVRANTEALAALREELRSHRVAETEMLSRLSRQIERLAG